MIPTTTTEATHTLRWVGWGSLSTEDTNGTERTADQVGRLAGGVEDLQPRRRLHVRTVRVAVQVRRRVPASPLWSTEVREHCQTLLLLGAISIPSACEAFAPPRTRATGSHSMPCHSD